MAQGSRICWDLMEGRGGSSRSGGEGRRKRGRRVAILAGIWVVVNSAFESWGKTGAQGSRICWDLMEGRGRSSRSGGEGRRKRGRRVSVLAGIWVVVNIASESWGKTGLQCKCEKSHEILCVLAL
nr:hypothetical protein [Tanacetum cinerariifolium]